MLDCAIYDCLNKAETLYNNSYAGKYSSQFQLFFFPKIYAANALRQSTPMLLPSPYCTFSVFVQHPQFKTFYPEPFTLNFQMYHH